MAGTYAEFNNEQLVHKMLSVERDLVAARFAHAQDKLENTAHLRVLRKDIARMQTETRRREIADGLGKDALIAQFRGSFASDGTPVAEGEDVGFLQGIVDKLTGSE